MALNKMKRGVSPVVATVLLIVMVIVLGLIVFLWFKSISKESITKFGGTNIELVCNNVEFTADYAAAGLTVANVGNVPIYSLNVKMIKPGSYETKEMKAISTGWPATGLRQGGVFNAEGLSLQSQGVTEIILIPILVGDSKGGQKTHVCEESQGLRVILR